MEAMALWEFVLGYDGGVTTEQIVIAEGVDETAAADGALAALDLPQGVALVRPGSPVPPDEATRWRSLCAPDSFPLVMSVAGRTARFARGH
jgi:hypothetical protein